MSSEKLGPDNLSSPARFWGSGVTGRLTPGLVTGGGMQCRLIADANLFNPTLVRKEGVSEGDDLNGIWIVSSLLLVLW
ncbi:unnamed protein product [Boreogadus saida]